MNTLRNKVSLIGRLGQEPTLQTVGKGFQLVKVSLATSENFKDTTGKWVEKTQWHNLVVWGKTAENFSKLATKGQEIMTEGRIVNRSYEKDSEKRYVTEIEVNDFLLLSSRNTKANSETETEEKAKK
ncbi:MAG: single-stranded DNA-binding protein [Flavobacteriales bacterium]|jgi:single-strand DNA-binding protein